MTRREAEAARKLIASPGEHDGPRPREDCTAERCWCKWLLFHAARQNAKLKKGGGGT